MSDCRVPGTVGARCGSCAIREHDPNSGVRKSDFNEPDWRSLQHERHSARSRRRSDRHCADDICDQSRQTILAAVHAGTSSGHFCGLAMARAWTRIVQTVVSKSHYAFGAACGAVYVSARPILLTSLAGLGCSSAAPSGELSMSPYFPSIGQGYRRRMMTLSHRSNDGSLHGI